MGISILQIEIDEAKSVMKTLGWLKLVSQTFFIIKNYLFFPLYIFLYV